MSSSIKSIVVWRDDQYAIFDGSPESNMLAFAEEKAVAWSADPSVKLVPLACKAVACNTKNYITIDVTSSVPVSLKIAKCDGSAKCEASSPVAHGKVQLHVPQVPWMITHIDVSDSSGAHLQQLKTLLFVLGPGLRQCFLDFGVPASLLRLPIWEQWVGEKKGANRNASWPSFVIDTLFKAKGLEYEEFSGASKYTTFGIPPYDTNTMRIDCWVDLFAINIGNAASPNAREKYAVNCYDLAALSQTLICLGGSEYETQIRYMDPFGFLKKCNLIGRPEVTDKRFSNHMLLTWKKRDGSELALDACNGPLTGQVTWFNYDYEVIDDDRTRKSYQPVGTTSAYKEGAGGTRTGEGLSHLALTAILKNSQLTSGLAQEVMRILDPLGTVRGPYIRVSSARKEAVATFTFCPRDADDTWTINIFRYKTDADLQAAWELRINGIPNDAWPTDKKTADGWVNVTSPAAVTTQGQSSRSQTTSQPVSIQNPASTQQNPTKQSSGLQTTSQSVSVHNSSSTQQSPTKQSSGSQSGQTMYTDLSNYGARSTIWPSSDSSVFYWDQPDPEPVQKTPVPVGATQQAQQPKDVSQAPTGPSKPKAADCDHYLCVAKGVGRTYHRYSPKGGSFIVIIESRSQESKAHEEVMTKIAGAINVVQSGVRAADQQAQAGVKVGETASTNLNIGKTAPTELNIGKTASINLETSSSPSQPWFGYGATITASAGHALLCNGTVLDPQTTQVQVFGQKLGEMKILIHLFNGDLWWESFDRVVNVGN